NGLSDTDAPVSGGRGATAESDWLAKKTIGGLDFRGVTRATFDSLGGSAAGRLSAFTRIGIIGGGQDHQITEGEMAYHTHSVYDPSHTHLMPEGAYAFGSGGYQPGGNLANARPYADGAGTGVQINFEGGNNPHNNVQPTRTVTTLIKL